MKRHPASVLARRYSSADIEQLRQMTKAARLHLIHGARQTEIAEKMGISQAGVSRLLRMAEEQGIIRSIVVPPEGLYPDLEEGLVQAYGLDAAYVVDVDPAEEGISQILGAAAARCLTDVFEGGPVLGADMADDDEAGGPPHRQVAAVGRGEEGGARRQERG